MTYALSEKVPPSNGPRSEESPIEIPKNEVYTGRLRSGTRGRMIIIPPLKIPVDARPAIARPIIKAIEDGEAPHNADPTSKTTRDAMKTHFVEYS